MQCMKHITANIPNKTHNVSQNKQICWVPHLTKDEHPPELASPPVSCELLVYFLFEGQKKKSSD